MSTSKPEIVISGGGWHTPESYAPFRTALESQGLTVHVPLHPTMNGSRPPNGDLIADSDAFRQVVTELVDAGRSVVVIMHSYGGQVGTNSLIGLGVEARKQQGLSGGVIQLIYLAAQALQEGQSGMSLAQDAGQTAILAAVIDFAEDGTCVNLKPKELFLSPAPGLPEEETEKFLATLGRWYGRCIAQPLQHCAWQEIPMAYIYTLNDVAFPMHYQTTMVERIRSTGREVRTFELESGHCPTWTMPEELATLVKQIVDSPSI